MTILYLTFGSKGSIWRRVPNNQSGVSQLQAESSGVTEELGTACSDVTSSATTFSVWVVGNGGSILKSSRTGNLASTWSKVHTAGSGLYGICYDGVGKWVAVGGNNLVVTSSDGTTWIDSSGAYPGATWNSIVYGNGQYVAVGSVQVMGNQQGAVMTSPDGVTWTKGNAGVKDALLGVAYSPDVNVFVACGSNGALVSVDGD